MSVTLVGTGPQYTLVECPDPALVAIVSLESPSPVHNFHLSVAPDYDAIADPALVLFDRQILRGVATVISDCIFIDTWFELPPQRDPRR